MGTTGLCSAVILVGKASFAGDPLECAETAEKEGASVSENLLKQKSLNRS
jgi:hypothetical protein